MNFNGRIDGLNDIWDKPYHGDGGLFHKKRQNSSHRRAGWIFGFFRWKMHQSSCLWNRASKLFHYGSESSSSISLFVKPEGFRGAFVKLAPLPETGDDEDGELFRNGPGHGAATFSVNTVCTYVDFNLSCTGLGYYIAEFAHIPETENFKVPRRNSSQDVLYSGRYSAILDFLYTGL